jgi:hypothetical protein
MLFLTLVGYSQSGNTHTSVANGDWASTLNWDTGLVPDNDQTNGNDDIIVTHNITLNDNLTVKSGTNITVEGCDTLHVTGNATFNNGSAILVEDCAVLIIDGDLTNNNNSTDVQINGKVIIGGNYDGGTGSELTGTGEMEVDGTVTTDGSGTVFGSGEDCIVDCDNSNDDPLGNDPLPVSLMWFNGAYEDDNIVLRWATASEINNDYFLIERLVDSEWETVTKQNGNGNSSSLIMYEHLDYRATYGYNYYRLTQFDYDGGKEVFHMIAVFKPYDMYLKDMKIYPNPSPAGEDINIELIGFSGDEILIIVMNNLQQIFFEKAVIVKEENMIVVLNSKLPAGTYLVIGSEKQELYRRTLIIK